MLNENNSGNINPISLLGVRRIFTTKQVEEKPIIACGKRYFFHDVVEVNIQKLELSKIKKDNREIPGILINKDREDELFVSMDETSLYTNRDVCINIAKTVNTKALNEIVEAKEEAQKSVNEYNEAALKLGKIIEYMK